MAQNTWRILVWQSIVEIRLVRCHVLSMISSSLIGKSCSVNPVQFPLKIKKYLLCIYKKGLNLIRYKQFFKKSAKLIEKLRNIDFTHFQATLISSWLLSLIFRTNAWSISICLFNMLWTHSTNFEQILKFIPSALYL